MEALQFDFMRNALAVGILVSIACGVIGTFVVINPIVFISGGTYDLTSSATIILVAGISYLISILLLSICIKKGTIKIE